MDLDLQLSRASETVIPSCEAAEKGVLSCILNEGNRGGGNELDMLGQLQHSDFNDLRNRGIFKGLTSLQGKDRPLNIYELLKALNGEADEEYTRSLLLECPSPLQFSIYLKDLKETAIRRRVYGVAQTGLKLSQDPNLSPDEVYEGLQDELRKVASLSSKGLPPIVEFENFIAKPLPKPTVLIEGLLHQGSKMLISGGSKARKTWALMDLGISVHTGSPFVGLKTTQTNVLFINLELQDAFTQERCSAIRRAKELADVKGMDMWNLRGYSCDISKLRKQLMAGIRQGNYGLIIIDPIYKVYGKRDENSVSDVAEIMNELEIIITETGAAVAFSAHQTKGIQSSKESIDRVSGSGAFARDVDSGLILTAHDQEDCYTAEASILRNFPPFPPFVLRWEYPLMKRDNDLNPDHLKERRNPNRAKEHSIEEIMAHVPVNEPIDKNELMLKANKIGKIAKNNINPLIEKATKEGKLYEHQIKRSGTNAKKQLARYPQELQGDLHDSHDIHV